MSAGRGKRCLATLLLAALFLTGCWDRIEIEDRAFVMAVAVDRARGEPKEAGAERVPHQRGRWLRLTFQIANPAKIAGGEQAGGGGGGGPSKPFWNLTTTSPSLFLAAREISTRVDRVPYFEHLQVVVLGEELARQGLEPVMDFFRRNGEMHRRVEVVVAEGEAKKVLDVSPALQPLPAFYLVDLVRSGEKRTGHYAPSADLTRVFKGLDGGSSFVLPRVVAQKQEVKVTGGAVIRKGRLVGWLGEVEADGLRWLTNKAQAGAISVQSPWGTGLEVFEVCHARTSIIPEAVGGRLSYTVVVETEGTLAEHQGRQAATDSLYLEAVNREVAETVEREIKATVKKLQQFRADAAGFGQELERRYPRLWQEVKGRWEEEVFPNLPVTAEVNVRVRLVGLHR